MLQQEYRTLELEKDALEVQVTIMEGEKIFRGQNFRIIITKKCEKQTCKGTKNLGRGTRGTKQITGDLV